MACECVSRVEVAGICVVDLAFDVLGELYAEDLVGIAVAV